MSGGIQVHVQYGRIAFLDLVSSFDGVEVPEPTEIPLPAPTAERLVTLQGTIHALDPASLLSFAPGADSLVLPLIEVPVELTRNGKLLGKTFTQQPDGRFEFTVPITDSLVLGATLKHAISSPPTFQVVYDQGPDPIWIATEPFALDENTPDVFVKNINLSEPGGLVSKPASIPPDRFDDVGLIYHYAREAWQMAAILLGLTFDMPTLDIRAFSSTPAVAGSAYWEGPPAGSAPYPALIEVSPRYSDFNTTAAPDTVMHEFGHHVMADAYANVIPYAPGDTFHAGFHNPTTTDSWIEGFATFFALWTKREETQARSPQLWHNVGTVENLELNYLAWSSAEELAVAALLWDLIDPVDAADATAMPVAGYASQPVITASTTTSYGDHVQLDRAELWRLLSDGSQASSDRPPDAPQGYPYIYDIQQLYETLTLNGIGLVLPLTPNGLDAVDELFIAHGFFADTNPQNLAWDPGETIGVTSSQTMTVGQDSFPARAARRSPPPVADSTIGYQVRDAATGAAADVTSFLVTVEFEPPYEGYTYSYITRAWSADRLQYSGPPRHYRATTIIAAAAAGVNDRTPLRFSNEEYWNLRDQQPSGPLLEHTFEVDVSAVAGGQEAGLGDGVDVEPPVSGAVNPGSDDDLVLGLVACGVVAGLVVLGAVLLLRARSRKARRAAAPGPGRAAGPGVAPAQVQPRGAGGASCPHCGQPVKPGFAFCGACGGALAASAPMGSVGRPSPIEEPIGEAQRPAGWSLLVVDGPGRGQRYRLGQQASLGRSQDNDIRLDDAQCSRHHTLFQQTARGLEVQDLGSTNGTWVNGRRIPAAGGGGAGRPGAAGHDGAPSVRVTPKQRRGFLSGAIRPSGRG